MTPAMRIVIDTNILVSGLLKPQGPPGRIVDLLLSGSLQALIDDRILLEYQQVLTRPRLGFSRDDVEHLLAYIRSTAITVTPIPLKITLPDEHDLPFLEVARAGDAKFIVTGNMKHFPDIAEAITPRDFVDRIRI